MTDHTRDFYIDGAWRPAIGRRHSSTSSTPPPKRRSRQIAGAGSDDVDRAVAAARNAFAAYAATLAR